MLRRLLDSLICPRCLPNERALAILADDETRDEIVTGVLTCEACGGRYHIEDGVADLRCAQADESNKSAADYETDSSLGAYLWSHFADLWDDPEAGAAYATWTGLLRPAGGEIFLDAGCSVGRMTFEAGAVCELAVGIDYSESFIRAARTLAAAGEIRFSLALEGTISQKIVLRLPQRLRDARVEFLLADAQALPFRRASFQAAASCNIVDKVPRPLAHLRECQRVCAASSRLLVCDPFSWSEEIAPRKNWLGGTETTGRAIERIPGLLEEIPGWRAKAGAPVSWTIRHHANRFERIFSQTMLAERCETPDEGKKKP